MSATEVRDKELILKALRTVSAQGYELNPKKDGKVCEIATKIISVEQASFKISLEPYVDDPSGFAKFIHNGDRDEELRFVCDIPALNAAIEFQTAVLKEITSTAC